MQTIDAKRSSTNKFQYATKALIQLCATRPMSTSIAENGYIAGSYVDEHGVKELIDGANSTPVGRSGSGHLPKGRRETIYTGWKVLPHMELANLPTWDKYGKQAMGPEQGLRMDPNAVAQKFIKTYGVLRGAQQDHSTFSQSIAEVTEYQNVLRRAWLLAQTEKNTNRSAVDWSSLTDKRRRILSDPGSTGADQMGYLETGMNEIEVEVQGDDNSEFGVAIFPDHVLLLTHDLWQFICLLFMRDYWNGKIGVCEDPDCPAPYLIKERVDRKYCQNGPCAAAAHTKSVNKWWRKNGQKKRAKKRGKSHR